MMGDVDVAHPAPAPFCALALAESANLPGELKVFASGVELAPLGAVHAAIAKEATATVDDMHHSGHLHIQVDADDALDRRRFRLRQRARYLSHPLAPLAFHTRHPRCTRRTIQRERSAPDADVLDVAVLSDRQDQPHTFHVPVLAVPLTRWRAQDQENA
jgi:hypothetical protein